MSLPMPDSEVLATLRRGVVIPASPLALDAEKKLDTRRQTALMRYYCAAGAGGVAVAVHTTQFEIRDAATRMFEQVLETCSRAIDEAGRAQRRRIVKIAGVCGRTTQALDEARKAADFGYDAALLSLAALQDASEEELIRHCHAVSQIIPLVGFYLQPAVGGRILPFSFWRRFVEIENVVAIKIAPFNRYQTLDVVRAVALAGRDEEIALYTGNDDNIIADLLTPFTLQTQAGTVRLRIRGGLLGQWSVWTRTAVRLLHEIHEALATSDQIPISLLEKHAQLTDANAAIFDAAHGFAGCIAGIHEVLRRQGLLEFTHALDETVQLSPGQAEEITRVTRDYPWLPDDDFVSAHLAEWLD
ncbi:MAG: dihydrodipicolinate synthetase [Candidatus Sumerlaea sp.]|nr:MAG: dihydrodipicolinate synthetase [Candidatus Sumerlaea sp.]